MAKLKLTEDQKNLVRLWIAEGKKDCEIVRLAKAQTPPFEISQQNINKTWNGCGVYRRWSGTGTAR